MMPIADQGFFSEPGQRPNNEDQCGYRPGRAYLVCDGVGGAEKGEVASSLIVKTFLSHFDQDPGADPARLLQEAEAALTAYINANPAADGMASTLTVLQVRPEGLLAGWVGDSRIYQFREGRIIFRTTDHSWVNEALRSGILRPEEAVNHPRSNVITRAVQGSHKPVQLDTQWITDLREGDTFLLCSDGVLEAWDDEELSALFAKGGSVQQCLDSLRTQCAQRSRDNNTALVLRLGKGKGPVPAAARASRSSASRSSGFRLWTWLIPLVVLASLGWWFFLRPSAGEAKDTPPAKTSPAPRRSVTPPPPAVRERPATRPAPRDESEILREQIRDLRAKLDNSGNRQHPQRKTWEEQLQAKEDRLEQLRQKEDND